MANQYPVLNRRSISTVGLYYVCYRLSRLGWTVAPATVNSKGVDILICGQNATRTSSVKVHALRREGPVSLGIRPDDVGTDFVVICRRLARDFPECFVLTSEEVERMAEQIDTNGRVRFWLTPEKYETEEFRERWDRIASALES